MTDHASPDPHNAKPPLAIPKPTRRAATLEETKQSILRYLNRYERDWRRSPVCVYGWEMAGCCPPELDPDGGFGVVMTTGRTRVALGQLVRDGLLHRERVHNGSRRYSLTGQGRALAPTLLPHV